MTRTASVQPAANKAADDCTELADAIDTLDTVNNVDVALEAREPSHRSPQEFAGWQKLVALCSRADVRKSTWQVINSCAGYFLGLIAMYYSLQVGYWLTLLLAFPTVAFLVRILIIRHDCGHGSFFPTRSWNDRVGPACGVVALTADRYWRKTHDLHHAHHADLEERAPGGA